MDADSIQIIDDEGRLFGVVNIVDALVILLVLAVFVAGIALLVGPNLFDEPAEGEPATRYATIEIGVQPETVAELVSSGDQVTVADGNLTIEDTYLSPAGGGVNIVVQTEIWGQEMKAEEQNRSVFQFNRSNLRVGDTVNISTDEYRVQGQVLSLTPERRPLTVRTEPTLLEATVPVDVAESIQTGDEYVVGNRTVGTIRSVQVYPTGDAGNRYVLFGARLTTNHRLGEVFFANRPLQIGTQVPFATDEYSISANTIEVGSAQVNTSPRSVTLEAVLPADVAESIGSGDTYQVRGDVIAQVQSVEVYATGESNRRYVLAELNLATIERAGDLFFAGRQVEIGNEIPFKTDLYNFNGTVVSREEAQLDTTQTPVVLKTTTSATTANAINKGDRFRTGGETVATIRSVQVYPTGNPNRKRVVLGVQLQTIERSSVEFGGTEVRVGANIPFETDTYSLQGTVVHVGETRLPGQETTTTAVVRLTNVDKSVAEVIEPGMVERRGGEVLARVRQKRVEPTTVTVKGDAAQFKTYQHPTQRNVYLTVELTTLRRGSELRFHGRILPSAPQGGSTVILALEPITVSGKVVEIRHN